MAVTMMLVVSINQSVPMTEETERRNGSQWLKLPHMLSLKPEHMGGTPYKDGSPFEHFIMTYFLLVTILPS